MMEPPKNTVTHEEQCDGKEPPQLARTGVLVRSAYCYARMDRHNKPPPDKGPSNAWKRYSSK